MSRVSPGRANTAGDAISSPGLDQDAYPCKLLHQALQPLMKGERRVLLDLGDAHGQTIEYFTGLPVRLAIASLTDDLLKLDPREDEETLQAHMESLLTPEMVSACDLVMVWEVLNYLQPRVITALMSRLAQLLPAGAQVHGFVAYSMKTLPQTPRVLVPSADAGLQILAGQGHGTVQLSGYPSGELQRFMPDFHAARAILLGDGMQEYLFVRR
ncbi:hypothetical protein [Thioalkalivibrio sulfidiphilus]|nr:hypothetical protein [Thioalkalivibrio sulfidiphilus]